jgi:hypothetical protein
MANRNSDPRRIPGNLPLSVAAHARKRERWQRQQMASMTMVVERMPDLPKPVREKFNPVKDC